jgi:Carboxypeptidase regulatory-like domain
MPMRSAVVPVLLVVALTTISTRGLSQGTPKPVTVTGLAFDSLRNVPLSNAFVTISERSRSATSDAKGRFVFDSVPPGTYTFAMQHAVFDSLGLSGATSRAVITDGKVPVMLAVPSFTTFWRAVCGQVPVPGRDSGLVYGTVRDARKGEPMADATVVVSWLDLVNLGTKEASNFTQRRWKSEAQADKRGDYAVCGVPVETQLGVRANYLMNASGQLDLPGSPDRVRRRDLVVPGISPADSTLRGTIMGAVNDDKGQPLKDVRVILDNGTEVRSAADGRFTIRDAPAGSRQLDFAAVGRSPFSTIVDVMVETPTLVTASMRTVTNLEAMRVTASGTMRRAAIQYEERRKQGFGSFMDSTAIGKRGTMAAVFYGMPGVTVQRQQGTSNARLFALYLPSTGTNQCMATLYFDGVLQSDQEIMSTLYPDDIAAVEVYQQRLTVPTEFMNKNPMCGVVAVWTKRAFRN